MMMSLVRVRAPKSVVKDARGMVMMTVEASAVAAGGSGIRYTGEPHWGASASVTPPSA